MERLLQEPAAWGIPAGPPMGNPVKPMPIPIAATTAMWSGYITVSLKLPGAEGQASAEGIYLLFRNRYGSDCKAGGLLLLLTRMQS